MLPSVRVTPGERGAQAALRRCPVALRGARPPGTLDPGPAPGTRLGALSRLHPSLGLLTRGAAPPSPCGFQPAGDARLNRARGGVTLIGEVAPSDKA